MESGSRRRRRLTLFEQMTAVENHRVTLTGLTLEDILRTAKRPEPEQQPPSQNRTLMEIIRDDGSNKDKKSWKMLLRLKRPVSSWTPSVQIPASDVIVNTNNRSQLSRNGSFRSHSTDPTDPPDMYSRMRLTGRDSADVIIPSDAPPSRRLRSEITAGNGTESSEDDISPVARDETRRLGAALAEESAREAAMAREAVAEESAREAAMAREAVAEESARAAAMEREAAEEGDNVRSTVAEPVRMSLIEFLEETKRRMGSRDAMIDGQDEENEEKELTEINGWMVDTCCVCMVRRKGAAFIPCGHTFCRVCSREVWVERGNCPLCNGTILEILDIF